MMGAKTFTSGDMLEWSQEWGEERSHRQERDERWAKAVFFTLVRYVKLNLEMELFFFFLNGLS